MKIIRLTAENVKKIRAVEIAPDGSLVTITGKNGSGKSSVLDSIFYALAGAKDLPKQPIRRGEQTARIRLDLGELIVTRKFNLSGSTLIVEGMNGARFPSPQRMLDDLIGAISFDPLAFSRMDPRGQFDMLRRVVKLDVDLDALAGQSQRDYDARTDINRAAKALRAQATAVVVPPDLPEHEIDVPALMDRMTRAASDNSDIERQRLARLTESERIARARQAAGEAEAKIPEAVAEIGRKCAAAVAEFEKEIRRVEVRITETKKTAEREAADLQKCSAEFWAGQRKRADDDQAKLDGSPALPDPIDVESLRAEIDQANVTNRAIAAYMQRERIEAEASEAETKSASLTAAIDARAKLKTEAIARAAMPIADLTFGDGSILYKDLPFDQASTAEQLRISVAIAMATNPKLRVLRVKEGSFLDDDGMQTLRSMAEAGDYQVWVETVHANGPVSIVMEDGSAKPPAEAADQPELVMGQKA